MTLEPTGRRPLLKAVAGGVVALGAVGVAARLTTSSDPGPGGQGRLTLSADAGSDVGSLEIRLGDLLPPDSAHTWRSSHLPTTTHSMVAFTWGDPSRKPHIEIKSRTGGVWQSWEHVPHLHDVPDAGSGESTRTAATDLLWIGDSDGIQIRVRHDRPDDLTLVLLHPRPRANDAQVRPELQDPRSHRLGRPSTTGRPVPEPALLSRQDWGADESWRNGKPVYLKTIQQVHVHHTVSVNNYAPADVPALIRGMYRYHTHTLGWSDIGYNFLVDRFGRAWVGRAGGPLKAVQGAHTLGFNSTSAGISTIGNFDLVQPTDATLTAIAGIAAWKLDLYHRAVLGTTAVRSDGSDRFSAGRVVTLPVIDGHRDTNQTACPGQHLYEHLPVIRAKAAALVKKYHEPVVQQVTLTHAPTVIGTPQVGQTLTATGAAFSPSDATVGYAWLRDGAVIAGASAATYSPLPADVGHHVGVQVTGAKAGYQPATGGADAGVVTAATTTTTVQAVSSARRATVRVLVAATGYAGHPDGSVTITIGKRIRTVALTNGAAVVRIHMFKPGVHDVTIDYSGSPTMQPSRAATTVTVT